MSEFPKMVKLVNSRPGYWHRYLVGEVLKIVSKEGIYYLAELTESQRRKTHRKKDFYVRPSLCENVSIDTNKDAAILLKKGG